MRSRRCAEAGSSRASSARAIRGRIAARVGSRRPHPGPGGSRPGPRRAALRGRAAVPRRGGAARHRPRGRGAADARGTAARDRAPSGSAPSRPARRSPGSRAAGIATGEVVHIDATPVRADVSWDAIARRHAGAVAGRGQWGRGAGAGRQRRGAARPTAGDPPAAPGPGRAAVCATDPDATLVKDQPPGPPRRARRQAAHGRGRPGRGGAGRRGHHGAGAAPETTTVEAQLDAVPTVTGRPVRLATMDAADAIARVFAALEGRAVEAVAPTKAEPRGRRAASSRSAGSSRTPGTGSYAARANASCARTASPTARDSKPTAPR